MKDSSVPLGSENAAGAARPPDPWAEERELMSRAAQGDAGAFGRIFERHRPGLYRMAYGMLHNADSAEDAVQETFLKGLDRISTYRGEAPPKVWVNSIAINVCRHRLRESRREADRAGEKVLDAGRRLWRPRTKGAASRAVQKESHRLLALAMGFLTDLQREVFLLHYEQDLSYEEVGRILGIRAGAARAVAHRAKATLRHRMEPEAGHSRRRRTVESLPPLL